MKRLVNAYGIRRAIDFLSERHTERGKLALWTIIELRWPALAEHLADNPDDVDFIRKKKSPPNGTSGWLRELFLDKSVYDAVKGEGVSAELTVDAIRECVGLRPAERVVSNGAM